MREERKVKPKSFTHDLVSNLLPQIRRCQTRRRHSPFDFVHLSFELGDDEMSSDVLTKGLAVDGGVGTDGAAKASELLDRFGRERTSELRTA